MYIQSQINKDTIVFIECETVDGFSKGDDDEGFRPDEAIENVLKLSSSLAEQLSAALGSIGREGTSVDIEFGVKIDASAVVSISSRAGAGQFKVRITAG